MYFLTQILHRHNIRDFSLELNNSVFSYITFVKANTARQ